MPRSLAALRPCSLQPAAHIERPHLTITSSSLPSPTFICCCTTFEPHYAWPQSNRHRRLRCHILLHSRRLPARLRHRARSASRWLPVTFRHSWPPTTNQVVIHPTHHLTGLSRPLHPFHPIHLVPSTPPHSRLTTNDLHSSQAAESELSSAPRHPSPSLPSTHASICRRALC